MTVTLKPETETCLSNRLTGDPYNLTEDEVAEIRVGIRRGMEAVAAGRERPVSEYMADVKKRRNARQTAKQ